MHHINTESMHRMLYDMHMHISCVRVCLCVAVQLVLAFKWQNAKHCNAVTRIYWLMNLIQMMNLRSVIIFLFFNVVFVIVVVILLSSFPHCVSSFTVSDSVDCLSAISLSLFPLIMEALIQHMHCHWLDYSSLILCNLIDVKPPICTEW